MNHAYSILLSENVEAAGVAYRDGEKLQLVCPACREPVHLVVRRQSLVRGWKSLRAAQAGAGAETALALPAPLTSIPASLDQALARLLPAAGAPRPAEGGAPETAAPDKPILRYFRHYDRDEAYEGECELRVAALGRSGAFAHAAAVSRDQKLRYFLSVLGAEIDRLHAEHPAFAAPEGRPIAEAARELATSKAVARLRDLVFELCREHARDVDRDEALRRDLDAFLTRTRGTRFEFRPTELTVETHRRIAADVWRHLLTRKARPNFDLLFNYSYLATHEQLAEAARHLAGGGLAEGIRRLAEASARLTRTGPKGADRAIEELRSAAATVPDGEGGQSERSLLALWTYNISNQMLGALVMLPYYELLRYAQDRRESAA